MKDPAFPLYAQDFIVGTMYMEFQDIGRYIKLLAIQWDKGYIPKKRLGFLLGYDWDNLTHELKEKFKEDENYIWNERLEQEREKRAKFKDKQHINGKKGGRPKINKNPNETQTKPKQNPLEDDNENENENKDDSLKVIVREKIKFSDLENTQWFESILRYLQLRITYDELMIYWKLFQEGMTADDDLYREKDDYRAHFRNWVKIQVDNNEKNRTNIKNNFANDTTKAGIQSLQERIRRKSESNAQNN